MNRMLMGVLGVAGFVAALAAPALAQECCNKDWIWTSDGKRWTRTWGVVDPYVMPTMTTVAVVPGEEREGDSWRMKYVRKSMEREYTREVPIEAVARGHECTWRLHYVGHTTTREHYCVENGEEQAMPDTTRTGERAAY